MNRQLLKDILPSGLLRYILYRKNLHFLPAFMDYMSNMGSTLLEDSKNSYKNIVSIEGFGYSGSGTLIDLFREFNNFKVLGSVDFEATKTSKEEEVGEINVVRHSGGLLEIEKYIGSNNIFHNDALLKRFVRLVETSPLYIKYPDLRDLYFRLFANVVDFTMLNLNTEWFNSHIVSNHDTGRSILFLKQMDKESFRKLCRCFLNELFNTFFEEGMEYLVLDQLFSNCDFDNELYLKYVPNVKRIVVYRDPRDVFSFAVMTKMGFIPHDDVDVFIQWYKHCLSKFDPNESNYYLPLRYEDIVYHYEEVKKDILKYLDTDESNHKRKKTCLDPDISKQYVGLYKNDIVSKNSIEKIYKDLNIFCFHG